MKNMPNKKTRKVLIRWKLIQYANLQIEAAKKRIATLRKTIKSLESALCSDAGFAMSTAKKKASRAYIPTSSKKGWRAQEALSLGRKVF